MKFFLFLFILLLFSCHKKKDTPIFDQMRGDWVWIDDSKGIELKFTKRVFEMNYETRRGYNFSVHEEELRSDTLIAGRNWKRILFTGNSNNKTLILYNEHVDTLLKVFYSYDLVINQQNDTVKRKYFVRK